MKRLLSVLLAAVLLCSLSIPAFAAEEKKEISVTAKYISTVTGEYCAPVENGEASVTVGEVSVSVTGIPTGAVTLVVTPIPTSEQEAYTWFAGCLEDIGTPLAIYDIYFLDADGSRINANGVCITIDYSVSSEKLTVCGVTTDGDRKDLSAEIKDGKAAFTANGSAYYVLTEKKADEPTPGTEPTTPAAPTGDNSLLWLWVLPLICSAGALVFIILYRRKRQKDE